MEKWAMVDDSTGINLSALYDLLREQFQNPDDPWYKETLKWWNEYVSTPAHPSICQFTNRPSQVFPEVSNNNDDRDVRDLEGPTMRERMVQEREARMAQGGPSSVYS